MDNDDYGEHLTNLVLSILELRDTDEDTDYPVHYAAEAYCNFKMFMDELGELQEFFGRPWKSVN